MRSKRGYDGRSWGRTGNEVRVGLSKGVASELRYRGEGLQMKG